MIPEIPLTVSGKLDRRALPAPEYTDADRYRAPGSAVEKILAGIYARVLGLERVGVDDSFFDLGGDSLTAMRVIATINISLDAHLSVRTLYDAPSVRSLSRRLGTHASSVEEVVPAVSPASDLQGHADGIGRDVVMRWTDAAGRKHISVTLAQRIHRGNDLDFDIRN